MNKTESRKIKDLECHCGECPDEIYSICEEYCNYQDEKIALCEQERFEEMSINEYEKINKILAEEAESEIENE